MKLGILLISTLFFCMSVSALEDETEIENLIKNESSRTISYEDTYEKEEVVDAALKLSYIYYELSNQLVNQDDIYKALIENVNKIGVSDGLLRPALEVLDITLVARNMKVSNLISPIVNTLNHRVGNYLNINFNLQSEYNLNNPMDSYVFGIDRRNGDMTNFGREDMEGRDRFSQTFRQSFEEESVTESLDREIGLSDSGELEGDHERISAHERMMALTADSDNGRGDRNGRGPRRVNHGDGDGSVSPLFKKPLGGRGNGFDNARGGVRECIVGCMGVDGVGAGIIILSGGTIVTAGGAFIIGGIACGLSCIPKKETPIIPAAPSDPDPAIPSEVEPEAPSEPEPKTPAESEPKTPVESEPKTPAESEPKTPAESEPENPTGPVQPEDPSTDPCDKKCINEGTSINPFFLNDNFDNGGIVMPERGLEVTNFGRPF